jgi:hypothetical protein
VTKRNNVASCQWARIDMSADTEQRRTYFDALREEARKFDTHILTLAGGALGLSLTFIRNLIPSGQEPRAKALIISAWSCFGLTLLIILVSFMTSQAACEKEIIDLENRKPISNNRWRIITKAFNILSIATFITGVVLFVIFAAVNL